MARYRFITADGQMFESTNTPEQIRKTYPESRITHEVGADAVGNPTFEAYVEKAPAKADDEKAPKDKK
jgi:hypothetical protein